MSKIKSIASNGLLKLYIVVLLLFIIFLLQYQCNSVEFLGVRHAATDYRSDRIGHTRRFLRRVSLCHQGSPTSEKPAQFKLMHIP
jgi:hypothetical protein